MAITPDEIENRVFPLVRRGYDPATVDDFLKDVASTLAQAQGGLATPPAALAEDRGPESAPAAVTGGVVDDFEQMGEEVAAILRQAHESVATLRHRAEADAALIRQNAQREADELNRRADADRQAAAIELEAARSESDRILADVQRQADGASTAATDIARERTREVIEAARAEARGAVVVQRNVRGRLEDTKDHIDQALDGLIEEDTDLFATIDLTDAAMAAAGDGGAGSADDVPPPGQGPPTPPVPPPTRTTPMNIDDLPYADEDDEDDDTLVVDLTGEADEGGEGGEDGEDDALSQMVKNAVENALRRRKGDAEPPHSGPT